MDAYRSPIEFDDAFKYKVDHLNKWPAVYKPFHPK